MNTKDGAPFIGSETTLEDSKVAVLLAPYEETGSYGYGASKGPDLIISASEQIESYDAQTKIDVKNKIHTKKLNFDKLTQEQVALKIYDSVKQIVSQNKFPVLLGGDHFTSYGAVKAAKEKYDQLTVLYIDAHADLRDEFDGTKWSHACTARRIHELGAKLVQVGIRSFSKEESDYIEKNRISVFYAPFSTEQIKGILDSLTGDVYISIDADGFDPSIVPAVGNPVPGGLMWYESLELFREVFVKKRIVGMDFVELTDGHTTRSQDLAATLIYRLMCYHL